LFPGSSLPWQFAQQPAARIGSGCGVIFSDGIEADFPELNTGMTAKISLAERHGWLVM